MNKPFSQACENNKQPILDIISHLFSSPVTVWEIGSGTGQHACFFAEKMPHIVWQATDRRENLAGIQCWIDDSALTNLPDCLELDVNNPVWPCQQVDALFTANTLHIMHESDVKAFFKGVSSVVSAYAWVCIYGPFNYHGQYSSASNAQFDQWLKARDPHSGIREIAWVKKLAGLAGLQLINDYAMPANNRLLTFQKDDL